MRHKAVSKWFHTIDGQPILCFIREHIPLVPKVDDGHTKCRIGLQGMHAFTGAQYWKLKYGVQTKQHTNGKHQKSMCNIIFRGKTDHSWIAHAAGQLFEGDELSTHWSFIPKNKGFTKLGIACNYLTIQTVWLGARATIHNIQVTRPDYCLLQKDSFVCCIHELRLIFFVQCLCIFISQSALICLLAQLVHLSTQLGTVLQWPASKVFHT